VITHHRRSVFGILVAAVILAAGVWLVPVASGQEHAGHMAAEVREAVCVLTPIGPSGVHGVVRFTAKDGVVHVEGKIADLKPGPHAFHVHEFGDLTDTKAGMSAGDHYNPMHMPHGRPIDQRRHAGDFGNIEADAQGVATISFDDPVVRLTGPHAIIGRSLVVHASVDKFTQPAGDAGSRVAEGVIGIAKPQQ
jgi:superoxide dismutase, Cu-Zn family